jgi:D-alanyl-D-alanine endopeptidase (penicillin-binding protein 7)
MFKLINAALAAALLSFIPYSLANSVLVYDLSTQEQVYAKNVDLQRPIASITKIMTAMVTLSYDQDLNRQIRVPRGSRLPAGMQSRRDVLTAMLVSSDNVAAATIAKDYPSGFDRFIEAMNQKAVELNMNNTRFADSSGLNRNNVSTAQDVGRMMAAASNYSQIRAISTQTFVKLDKKVGKRKRHINLGNTNRPLLVEFDEIVVSKTGFTNPAGFCVAMVLEKNNRKFTAVVLGMNNKQERFRTAIMVVKEHMREIEIDNVIRHKQPRLAPEPEYINYQII